MKLKNWRKRFFILLSINIGLLLLIIISILIPGKVNRIYQHEDALQGYAPFVIHTNKEHLNEVINHYINKEASGPVNYQVVLGKDVELYGEIPFFTEVIEMKMTFEPKAVNNGDLMLQQKSMSIGQMKLPVPYILKFIKNRYQLPKGVLIRPNNKLVYISMQSLKMKSDFKIRVNKFDLANNDISFILYVPTK